MGFRNPFRIQVDENDVAYITDYSPDSQTPQRVPRAAGAGRFEIVRKPANYGWPLCYRHDSATTSGTSTASAPLPSAAAPELERLRARRAARRTTRAGSRTAARQSSPASSSAPGHRSGDLVLLPRQQPDSPARHAVLRLLRRRPAIARSPGVPAAVPGAYTGGVGPHGDGEVPLRPGQPEPEEVPAVLRRLGDLRASSRRTRCARSSSTRRTLFKINNTLPTAGRPPADAREAVRVRQPDGHAVRGRRLVLPADLRRRLLQHQPRRRHVQVGLRQGPARAEGRPHHRQDRRPGAADGQLLQRGLARRRSGRLDPLRVGLRRRHGDSIEPNPTHTYTQAGRTRRS